MDAQTKAFYTTHAEQLGRMYAEAGDPADLLATFRDCGKILDLGCGSGRDLAAFLRAGKDACGADAVPEMLTAAEKNLAAQGIATHGRLFAAELPNLGCEPRGCEPRGSGRVLLISTNHNHRNHA